MCAAQDKFDEFLGRMKLLSLGVLRNNLPYCCSAFYVYDPQNKELIIASASDSEHIKAVFANRGVAATVALDTKFVGRIKGVQICGHIRSADERETSLYLKRFPFARAMETDFFTIRIDWMKMTDNTLTFGKKLIWER